MAKKKKSRERLPNHSMGFMSGLGCGLFVAFIVYLWSSSLPPPSDLPKIVKDRFFSTQDGKSMGVVPSEDVDKLSHPTFYQFLPGDKMPIPLMSADKSGKEGPGSKGVFLQAGSFTKFEDADGQKARLALLGVLATIETTKGRGSSLWYRVRIGPMSKAAARALKKRLESEKFEILVSVRDD